MSKIQYPSDWLGIQSTASIINFGELTKLVKANGLNDGHLSYLIGSIQDTVLGNIDKMLRDEQGEK